MTASCFASPPRTGLLAAALLGALVLLAAGCESQARRANMGAARQRGQTLAAAEPRAYTLQPGDELSIKFFYNSELDTITTIRPDGRFSLPLIDEVVAHGKTLPDLSAELEERFASVLKHPEITVNVDKFASQVVFIGGEVRQPGVIPLVPGMTVMQGVFAAGGWLGSGDSGKVVVVRNQGTTEPLFILIDLNKGLDELGGYRDLTLAPKDMVFVPMTGIAKANQFIREYIRDMLPIQSSFSLQYQFTNLQSF